MVFSRKGFHPLLTVYFLQNIYYWLQPLLLSRVGFDSIHNPLPSSTSSKSRRHPRCKPTICSDFKIHCIWPQDRYDKPIPPYKKNNPCTRKTPSRPKDLRPKPSRTREQLWEIHLCYDRPKPEKLPNKLLNCTHQLPIRNGCRIGLC
ncbi:hypothetical protein J1N35_038020 [Gossypium stocksii]|uniref:Uncharacterized protein n=1 Tax=Gossypium stocksii TaxID=47602 RepID=A0A9D3ZLG8_9ROSI|nr:hypothetical protein J1N35_038020 [Gossypium stocksii]